MSMRPAGDGVKGKPNYVLDPITGKRALGRFGWKASVASLEVQDAKALDLDIGLSNRSIAMLSATARRNRRIA